MEQILLGIILLMVGMVSLLDTIGFAVVALWWVYASPVLIMLIGVFMMLRAQGRMATQQAKKRATRESEKEKHITETEEVIGDLVDPKTSL